MLCLERICINGPGNKLKKKQIKKTNKKTKQKTSGSPANYRLLEIQLFKINNLKINSYHRFSKKNFKKTLYHLIQCLSSIKGFLDLEMKAINQVQSRTLDLV
jgi:hypothetical protein